MTSKDILSSASLIRGYRYRDKGIMNERDRRKKEVLFTIVMR